MLFLLSVNIFKATTKMSVSYSYFCYIDTCNSIHESGLYLHFLWKFYGCGAPCAAAQFAYF